MQLCGPNALLYVGTSLPLPLLHSHCTPCEWLSHSTQAPGFMPAHLRLFQTNISLFVVPLLSEKLLEVFNSTLVTNTLRSRRLPSFRATAGSRAPREYLVFQAVTSLPEPRTRALKHEPHRNCVRCQNSYNFTTNTAAYSGIAADSFGCRLPTCHGAW